MAGSKSNYLENALNDHVLGGPDYVRPAIVYVALYTVVSSDAGDGAEVSGGSYARVAVFNTPTSWPASLAGFKTNGVTLTFATASAPWGMVVGVGIFDALSGGNQLYWADLGAALLVLHGDTPRFDPGMIRIQED